MCFPKAPKDNSAKIAREEEEKRAADVAKGKAAIDAAFARFSPGFYDRMRNDYVAHYEPQIDDQFGRAKRTTILGLGRQGIRDSSAGARTFADLLKLNQRNRLDIGNSALSAANQARDEMSRSKADLLAQNSAVADPAAAAASAVARSDALYAPLPTQPLADLFSAFTGQFANAVLAERQGYRGWGTGLFAPPRTASTVVT